MKKTSLLLLLFLAGCQPQPKLPPPDPRQTGLTVELLGLNYRYVKFERDGRTYKVLHYVSTYGDEPNAMVNLGE